MKFLLDHDVPDDIEFALSALGHEVIKLREVLPSNAADDDVWHTAGSLGSILISCNRDDFIRIAREPGHGGLIILIRRRSRALERAALVRLLDQAGEVGIQGNINFA